MWPPLKLRNKTKDQRVYSLTRVNLNRNLVSHVHQMWIENWTPFLQNVFVYKLCKPIRLKYILLIDVTYEKTTPTEFKDVCTYREVRRRGFIMT